MGKEEAEFQWNSEVDLTTLSCHVSLSDEPAVIVSASELILNRAVDVEALQKPPFNSFSINTLSSLRDNAYTQNIYNFTDSEPISDDVNKHCASLLQQVLQRRVAYDCDLDPCCFRPLVLLSLLAPYSVIQSLLYWLQDCAAALPEAGTSLVLDGFMQMRSALSYCMPSGQSLLAACLERGLSLFSTDETATYDSPLCSLLTLLLCSPTNNSDMVLSCETCIEQVAYPFVKAHELGPVATIMHIVAKFATNKNITLQVSHAPCAAAIIKAVIEFTASDTSWSVLKDVHHRPTENLDKAIDILNCYAQCLSSDVFQQHLHYAGVMAWPIEFNLLPFVVSPDECATAVRNEFHYATTKIKHCESGGELEVYEKLLILCATLPFFPNDFEAYKTGKHSVIDDYIGDDQIIEKWIAVLVRQCPQLTFKELSRLFNLRLAYVLHKCLHHAELADVHDMPEDSQSCHEQRYMMEVRSMQVGLQAVCGMLHFFPEVSQRQTYADGALRVCRTICSEVVTLVTEDNVSNGVGLGMKTQVSILQLLLRFVLGHFDEEGAGMGGVRASCNDFITVTLIEIVRCYGIRARQHGKSNDLARLASEIDKFIDGTDYSKKICLSATTALMQNRD